MADDRRSDHLYTLNRDHDLKNHAPPHGRSTTFAGPSPHRYLAADFAAGEHSLQQNRLSPHTLSNSAPFPGRQSMVLVPGLSHLPLQHSLPLQQPLSRLSSSNPNAGLLSMVGPPPLAPISQYAPHSRASPVPPTLSRVSPKPAVVWDSPGPPNPPQISPLQSLGHGLNRPQADNRVSPGLKQTSPNPKLPYNRASPKSHLGVSQVSRHSPGSRASPNRNSPAQLQQLQQRLSPAGSAGSRGTSPLSVRVSPLPNCGPHINSRVSPGVIPKVIVQPPQGMPLFQASGLVQLPVHTGPNQGTDRTRSPSAGSSYNSKDRKERPNSLPVPNNARPSYRSSPDPPVRVKVNDSLAPLPAHSHPGLSPPRRASPHPPNRAPPPAVLPEDLSIRTVKPYSTGDSHPSLTVSSGGGGGLSSHLTRVGTRSPQAPAERPSTSHHHDGSLAARQPALAHLLKAPVLASCKSSTENLSNQMTKATWSTSLSYTPPVWQWSQQSPSRGQSALSQGGHVNHPHRNAEPHVALPNEHKPDQAIPTMLTKSLTEIPATLRHTLPESRKSPLDSDMPRLYPQDNDIDNRWKGQAFVFEARVKEEPSEIAEGNVKQEEAKMEPEKEVLLPDVPCHPFNMRVTNLTNLQSFTSHTTYRTNYRTHSMALLRAKTGSICNPAKSLDILRQNLQKHINDDLDKVIQKYTREYFEPAMENIRENQGEVGSQHLLAVCRQMLEEGKKLYVGDARSATPDVPDSVSEAGSSGLQESKTVRDNKRSLFNIRKRRGSSDSDASIHVKKKKGRPPLNRGSGRSTPQKNHKHDLVKKEGPKWDPDRLKEDTQFVMGARANKALGFGATRGRLYIKHPDIFKYAGDQDDKTWLYENGHMPATGGKTYLLLVQDIMDICELDEYKNGGSLLMHEVVGFTVPQWMLDKMQNQMRLLRTDTPRNGGKSRPVTLEQAPSTESNPKEETDEDSKRNGKNKLPFSSSRYSENTPSSSGAAAEGLDISGDGDEDDPPTMSPLNITGGFTQLDDELSPAPSDLTNGGDGLEEDLPLTAPFHIPIG